MSTTNVPVVLVPPDVEAALKDEANSTSLSGELTGGLLFGHPLDDKHRLVLGFVRLPPLVGFGTSEFAIDQSRTSEDVRRFKQMSAQADYCGVWYLHRTPDPALTDKEWVQAQATLDDPDLHFKDLICLVVCFYFGKVSLHALYLDAYRLARSQPLALVELCSTANYKPAATSGPSMPLAAPSQWQKDPRIANRLQFEKADLAANFQVQAGMSPHGEMIFQLCPKVKYEQLTFYLACGSGFPNTAPRAFILAGQRQLPLSSPELVNWTAQKNLTTIADDLLQWVNWSLEDYVKTAQKWLESKDYGAASALLKMVLSIEPRTPKAARLLARAQARAD